MPVLDIPGPTQGPPGPIQGPPGGHWVYIPPASTTAGAAVPPAEPPTASDPPAAAGSKQDPSNPWYKLWSEEQFLPPPSSFMGWNAELESPTPPSTESMPPLSPQSSTYSIDTHFVMMNQMIEDNTPPPTFRRLTSPPSQLILPGATQLTTPATHPQQEVLQLQQQLQELTHWVERGGGEFLHQLQSMKDMVAQQDTNFRNLSSNQTPEGWNHRVEEAITALLNERSSIHQILDFMRGNVLTLGHAMGITGAFIQTNTPILQNVHDEMTQLKNKAHISSIEPNQLVLEHQQFNCTFIRMEGTCNFLKDRLVTLEITVQDLETPKPLRMTYRSNS